MFDICKKCGDCSNNKDLKIWNLLPYGIEPSTFIHSSTVYKFDAPTKWPTRATDETHFILVRTCCFSKNPRKITISASRNFPVPTVLARSGLDPLTSRIWVQHASTHWAIQLLERVLLTLRGKKLSAKTWRISAFADAIWFLRLKVFTKRNCSHALMR